MSKSVTIHASAAWLNNQVVLIFGKSSAGKSTLLVALMARGFELVGDDLLTLEAREGKIWVQSAPHSHNRFEVRGIGIHEAEQSVSGFASLAVNLDTLPAGRLPENQFYEQFGVKISLINGKDIAGLADYLFLLFSKRIKKHTKEHTKKHDASQ